MHQIRADLSRQFLCVQCVKAEGVERKGAEKTIFTVNLP